MTEKLEFKISSALKNIIGRDLITDDFIAVFELVKNSYDAFAKNVIITFEDDKIIIADDGKGMSINDLKEKWLFLGFSAKKDGTEDEDIKSNNKIELSKSKNKRYYAGAKGIGRFSSDRLGEKLTLTTRHNDNKDYEQIIVDWKEFEKNQKQEFKEVFVVHNTLQSHIIPFPIHSYHGTILEISSLNSRWNRAKIKELKHSLEKLINPFSNMDNFTIEIICEREMKTDKEIEKLNNYVERNRINGVIKNSILEILDLKTTQIDIKIDNVEIITKLIDRGTEIYHIKEQNNEYTLLEDVKINLYYLNQSAKNNFTRKMGIAPVNYGSIFLFKNGFRVQPYGNSGDDSWQLDYRAQQGYNRFLGTRDLFGRVEINTDRSEEFKEVSSRDGGLIKTIGQQELISAFNEFGLKRLERYVVGVLWGERFLSKKYFEDENLAKTFRKQLQTSDKTKEDISTLKTNLASKIDFVQLIKNLVKDKNVEIINYNKELVNIFTDDFELIKPKFINDLEEIAEKTKDSNLLHTISDAKKQIQELQKALEEERKAREEAEKKTEKERKAKEEAERKAEEERKAREEAEKKTEKERKAKEEAEKRADEEARKRKDVEEERDREARKAIYFFKTRKDLSKDADALIHHIKNTNLLIRDNVRNVISKLREETIEKESILENLSSILKNSEKALKAANLITNTELDDHNLQKIDIVKFVESYINTLNGYKNNKNNDLVFQVKIQNFKFIMYISVIELTLIIDNLIENAVKWSAETILIEVAKKQPFGCMITISDDGQGLSEKYLGNPEEIFELKESGRSDGSGIGLYVVREMLTGMGAKINFLGNHLKLKGAAFEIIFN